MIVADASVWIDYFNGLTTGQTALLAGALLNDTVLVGDIIITEILQGIRNDDKYIAVKKYLCGAYYHTFLGKRLSIRAAQNYRLLRKKGITIRKTIDVILATFCIKYGYPLLHNDRDFDMMEKYLGLKVVR